MTVQDLAFIAICVALATVLGKGLGVLYKIFPPGRVFFNAPVYSMLVAMILYKVRKHGAMVLFGAVYGLLMIRFSPFASLSIFSGAVLAELAGFLITKNFESSRIINLVAPLYSLGGVIATMVVGKLFLPGSRIVSHHSFMGWVLTLLGVYILGYLGSRLATKVILPRVFTYGPA